MQMIQWRRRVFENGGNNWGRELQGPKGRCLRPEGPKARVGFLGRGSEPPPHQLGSLGEHVSSSSGVRGGTLTAERFLQYFSCSNGSSCIVKLNRSALYYNTVGASIPSKANDTAFPLNFIPLPSFLLPLPFIPFHL